MRTRILYGPNSSYARRCGLQSGPSVVRASIIDYDNLVWNPAQPQLDVQMLYGGLDASGLVSRRNHDREQLQRRMRV